MSSSSHHIARFLSHAILSELDEDTRPLGEQAIPGAYQRAGVDEHACPYSDRRRTTGKPMNVAALRQVSMCWKGVLAQLQRLATLHQDATGGEYLTGHQMWRVHLLALAGPALFQLEHANRAIPRELSALFKTSLGYATILPSLLLSQPGSASTRLVETLPPEDFFTLCDEQGWLIGQGQVCAGSASRIKQSYDAMGRVTVINDSCHTIFERPDLDTLSEKLAWIWAELLRCAIWTRDLLAQGEGHDLPGYLDPSPRESELTAWPVCVRLYRQRNAPRHFVLPRAMPGLTPAHITTLFVNNTSHTTTTFDSFEALDERMHELCNDLGNTLSLPSSPRHHLATCYAAHRLL